MAVCLPFQMSSQDYVIGRSRRTGKANRMQKFLLPRQETIAPRKSHFSCFAAAGETVLTTTDDTTTTALEDFLVTDSLHLPDDERPSLLETLQNPRDALAMMLLLVASGVAFCNIGGNYAPNVYSNLERASIVLGFLSGFAGFWQAATGYLISRPWIDSLPRRRGLSDDTNVNIYAGLYALTVSWLSLRTSTFCPHWLIPLDGLLPWMAIAVFVLAVLTPAVTLINPGNLFDDDPPLSETELLRMRGMLAIGVLASVFAPECFMFAAGGGSDWWDRVSLIHPAQRTLESSTCLFALYANEASMVSHRCGRAGVATFDRIVPSFAVVCFLLAIVPCVAAIYWLGNDVSFFSIYQE